MSTTETKGVVEDADDSTSPKSGGVFLKDLAPVSPKRSKALTDLSLVDPEAEMPSYMLEAIGTMESCFKEKNGTPRQGWLAPMSRARLTLKMKNNQHHSLDGLDGFSHIWLIFMFSLNKASKPKFKVQPPRLNGARVGVFSTRSPHRPNNIGITLAKIESIDFETSTLHLSGIDLVESTPILDIKPYIPEHDNIQEGAFVPDWIGAPTVSKDFYVEFSPRADFQLDEIIGQGKLQFYKNAEEIKTLIKQVLATEPRSMYRRVKTKESDDGKFGFCVDILNVITVYNENDDVRVIEIEDWSDRYVKKRTKYVQG
eukprot:CFRG1419T1